MGIVLFPKLPPLMYIDGPVGSLAGSGGGLATEVEQVLHPDNSRWREGRHGRVNIEQECPSMGDGCLGVEDVVEGKG